MKVKFSALLILILFPLASIAKSEAVFHNYHNGEYLKTVSGLKSLADQNNKIALYHQGMTYINGYGVTKNLQKGIKLLSRSGNLGYLPAQMFLGNYYFQQEKNAEKALYWFKKAAELGNVDAQMYTAAAYLYGYGVKRNPTVANKYVIYAAKNGNPVAQYTLAQHFLKNKYKKDKQLAIIWLTRSANQNNAKAQYVLGKLYYEGRYIAKDKSLALKLLTKSARQNNMDAVYLLGVYNEELGNSVATIEALHWFQKAAKANKLNAQYRLGMLYLSKDKSVNNDKEGYFWILKAAQQGDEQAQKQLATMYEKGIVVNQNAELTQQWLLRAKNKPKKSKNLKSKQDARKLALAWIANDTYKVKGILSDWSNEKSRAQGAYNLSPKVTLINHSQIFKPNFAVTKPNDVKISEFIKVIGELSYQRKKQVLFIPRYQFPEGTNYKQLFLSLSRQASHGYARSQFELGMMYEQGLGVKKDVKKAIALYHESAKQNYLKADYNIGLLYLEGNGVDKNYRTALAWLHKAAFKGEAHAQYLLALIHEYGLGQQGDKNYIPRDINYAKAMYNLAASNGYAQAKYNLAALYSSGLFNENQSVQSQQDYYKLLLGLYESAAKQGVKGAEISLAYYYADNNNKKKQDWAFKVANKEAKQGNVYAEFISAVMYDRGIGVEKNRNKAIDLYGKVVDRNNPLAQFILGTYYYLGEGVGVNKQKATELLTKAARQDFPYADYNLAVIKHNENPNSDFLPLLQRAAANQYNKASLLLADYYLRHAQDRQQLKTAADIYQQLATRGYAKAQLKLGYMYEQGLYFQTNYSEAEIWYTKSALQNNQQAQFLLANMYQVGKLGKPNIVEAKKWYKKAASQGFTPAAVALGFINENIDHNYQQALNWYQKAAQANNPQGQFDLALLYEYGKGIPVDYKKAFEWYSKAAQQNIAAAKYSLGTMYLHGLGVKASERKALEWYRLAAEQRDIHALYQLGLLNEAGVGVKINDKDAVYYYTKAAQQGNSKAKRALKRLQLGESGTAINKPEIQPADITLPMTLKPTELSDVSSPNRMYLQALNELNEGDVNQSVAILTLIQKKFPDYIPAKKTWESLTR